MTGPPQRKVLRPSGKVAMVVAGLSLASLLLGLWRLHAGDKISTAGVFILLAALSATVLINHLMQRIVLLPDPIEFGALLGKRTIQRDQIESVTWEAGCGVSVRTKEQKWIRVPDLGRAQGVCNSIRAWLNREKSKA